MTQATTTKQDVLVSTNPATLEANGEVPVATAADVQRAVEAARAAQPAWGKLPLRERQRVLDGFQHVILQHKADLAALVTAEAGKPLAEAMAADLFPAVDAVKFLRERGPALLQHRIALANPLLWGRRSYAVREPRGVVGLITPWNYPLGIPASQLAYALAAGNAVVWKPSELTPLTATRIAELLTEAGLPEGVLNVVQGEGIPTGAAVVESAVDYLLFTGSEEVGTIIQRSCGPRGVPTCLELGGSDPAIVLEDANLELTSDGIVWCRFANAGQTCAAVKRLYAVDAVFDELVDRVVEKTSRLVVGDGAQPGVDVGPVISAETLDRIEAQVDASVAEGATVLLGGHRVKDLPGHFYAPTILGDVTPDMPVLTEETFGPVLPVVRVADAEEAVALANASRYGLTASVWTQDLRRGEAVARRLQAGTVTLNDHTYTYAANATPWGGVKASGHGSTHGPWGLQAMTTLKHVNVAQGRSFPRSLRPPNLWWFPYGEEMAELVGNGLETLYGQGIGGRARRLPRVVRELLRPPEWHRREAHGDEASDDGDGP